MFVYLLDGSITGELGEFVELCCVIEVPKIKRSSMIVKNSSSKWPVQEYRCVILRWKIGQYCCVKLESHGRNFR